jgi:carboxyl-terminal processing protease
MKEQVGGGFGLTVAILDDNRLIVDWVSPQGPAAAAGIKPSAQIIRWGGLEASDALKAASTIWATVPSATDENKEFEQAKFLTRAPLGQTREVAFANPGEDEQQVSLTAYDDGMESLERQQQYSQMFFGKYPERMVESRALEAGVGYIKIYGEGDLSDKHPGDHTPTLEQFRTAIDTFVKSNASGLIIDVRSNAGGEDEMSADFLASFYDRKVLYEYQKWYNAETGKAAIVLPYEDGRMQPNTGLFIEPRPPIFKGPVTILVNNGCISSGEGIALGIKNLPNGSVVGFRGTNGSFGMVMGALINMPGGYTISYPVGQSLGKNKVVQIDSRNGEGGVAPDIRVPRDLDTVTRAAAGEDVELEYAIKSILEAQND